MGPVLPAGSYAGDYTQLGVGNALALIQTAGAYQFLVSAAPGVTLTGDIPTDTRPYPYDTGFHPMQAGTPVLTQLVLTLNATSNISCLYVNGHLAQSVAAPLTPLGQWLSPTSFLSFAQTPSTLLGPTWSGQVRLLAVYTGALTEVDVAVNWNAALIEAVPQPPPVLVVGWTRGQPVFEVNFSTAGEPVVVTVVGVPAEGVLEYWNGTAEVIITEGSLPLVLVGGGSVEFTYTPGQDNGTYTANITYTVRHPCPHPP